MSVMDGLAARIIQASTAVDRSFRLFIRLRSALVVRFASDGALDAYNNLAYGKTTHFTPGGRGFVGRLFAWEESVTSRYFPRAPARLLIGGTGGGREALAWAARGYEIVGFDPSASLARSMAAAGSNLPVRTFLGRYETLPHVTPLDGGETVDLRRLAPFGAAIFGMGSYSHLRSGSTRIDALRAMGELTDGPVLVSFPVHQPLGQGAPTRLGRLGGALGFRQTGDAFSPELGFYHSSTPSEIEADVLAAGLTLLGSSYRNDEGQWPWIVARREGSHAGP